MQSIITWNVNGFRAAQRNGSWDWLLDQQPAVFCLQETKAQPDQIEHDCIEPPGYLSFWHSAERKGYSGVATYTKFEPLSVEPLHAPEFDVEGRGHILEFPEFTLLNCYFPNSQEAGARLPYKLAFCAAIADICARLSAQGKHVLLCGDLNIAHRPIDLANPKENEQNPGYLPEERAWLDAFLNAGYVDAFRLFTQEGGHYTWWTYRTGARQRNVGWRIDYHCVNESFVPRVESVTHHSEVLGSDHCPVEIRLDV